ncbi:hypothetical protein OCAE111667_14125 [Occultella aeris]|uniref:Uncharacterized protein n=1 Tax=Occultella aeris TaxID=2761496 RepID=A0A7M4DIV2_9MICO|nr:hypothetical protein [Occultella aeris]VZO36916.1 hypothetical protein HALOF300_02055 [Occultella aeris]
MSNNAAVDLIRSLTEAMNGPSLAREMRGPVEDWESLAMILEFGDGYRSVHGYAYSPGSAITAVACDWASIEPEVQAYLGDRYEPGDPLPVKILVQFDRATGEYKVTFEDTDEERWAVKPANYRQMREQLRPKFD